MARLTVPEARQLVAELRATGAITKDFLLAREAAALVRISYQHFRELAARGETPAIGGGRSGVRALYAPVGLLVWASARGERPSQARKERVA